LISTRQLESQSKTQSDSPFEVVKGHDLCLDEAPLKVGVDDTSSLGGQRALEDRPAANLYGIGGGGQEKEVLESIMTAEIDLLQTVAHPPRLADGWLPGG